MIAQILNTELNQLHDTLGQNQSRLLLLTGKWGSGKSLLLKLVERQIQSSEQNSATLFYRWQPTAGFIPQLIELESWISNLAAQETKTIAQSSLSSFLRSKLAFDRPVITGKPLSADDASKLLQKSIEAVSEKLGTKKLYLLMDLTDTNDSKYDEIFLKLFGNVRNNNIQTIIATSESFQKKDLSTRIAYLALDPKEYMARFDQVTDKSPLNETALKVWRSYQGNLLVLDSLTRFVQAFGTDSLTNGIEKVANALDLGTFIKSISAQIFLQSGAAEQMLLMGLACSVEPLTKVEFTKAINWDTDYLERVLTERPRIITMLDQESYRQNKLAIYHSSIRQGILNAALRGQTRLIHKRLTKNYLHRDLNDYWSHPKDIEFALYHLRASETPEIVNFLLLTEVKTLSRLWGLNDIMIETLEFAIGQVKSYKSASVSFEVVDSNESLNFQIGEEDVKAAEYSLYREYAYFLEINGQNSQAADAWERSLKAADRSGVNAAINAKLKAMVWADIAQLCFENSKLSEAIDALQKQIQYLHQGGIKGNMLAAALHNLGLVQISFDLFSEARESFEQALSASEKLSLQAAVEIIQIAHTWRLAGNRDRASSSYHEAVNLAEALGEKGGYLQAVALGYLALGQLEQGNLSAAYDNAKRAKSLFKLQGASNDEEMADQLLQEIQRAQKESR